MKNSKKIFFFIKWKIQKKLFFWSRIVCKLLCVCGIFFFEFVLCMKRIFFCPGFQVVHSLVTEMLYVRDEEEPCLNGIMTRFEPRALEKSVRNGILFISFAVLDRFFLLHFRWCRFFSINKSCDERRFSSFPPWLRPVRVSGKSWPRWAVWWRRWSAAASIRTPSWPTRRCASSTVCPDRSSYSVPCSKITTFGKRPSRIVNIPSGMRSWQSFLRR